MITHRKPTRGMRRRRATEHQQSQVIKRIKERPALSRPTRQDDCKTRKETK